MFLPLAMLTLFSPVASAQLESLLSTGKVYFPIAAKEHSFLYESKTLVDGARETIRTIYKDKEGKPLVEEETLYQGGKLQKYVYRQLQMQEGGEVRVRGSKVFFEFLTAKGKKKEDEIDWEENMTVPTDLQRVISKHWSQIKAGESVKVRFLLVERQDDIGFKLFHDGEIAYEGRKAAKVIMKPSSIIIAALAPSFKLVIDEAPPHRILESVGRLPIRVPEVKEPKGRNDYRAVDAKLVLDYFSRMKEEETSPEIVRGL